MNTNGKIWWHSMDQYSLEISWCEGDTNHHTQYLLAWPGKCVTNSASWSGLEFNYEIISRRHDTIDTYWYLIDVNILQPGKYSAGPQCGHTNTNPGSLAWGGKFDPGCGVACRALSGPDGKASPGLSLNQWSLQGNEAKYIIHHWVLWQCSSVSIGEIFCELEIWRPRR